MASEAEVEVGSTYENAKQDLPIRVALEEMNPPHPKTPMQVDNTTTEDFANKRLKQKRSKANDMQFYWIQYRFDQKQFMVYWQPGSKNLGDYYTK